MGAPSFGSFGPAGPGFGSIQNAPATGVNPTAFPTAPPSPPSGGMFGGGGAPTVGGGGLGNMVGAQVSPLSQGPTPQPYRAPLPLPPPPAAAAIAPAPAAAAPQPNAPNDLLYGMNPGGSGPGPAFGGGFNSLFGLGGGQVGAGGNQYSQQPWRGMGSGGGGGQ
jgi:hypothetical protein